MTIHIATTGSIEKTNVVKKILIIESIKKFSNEELYEIFTEVIKTIIWDKNHERRIETVEIGDVPPLQEVS